MGIDEKLLHSVITSIYERIKSYYYNDYSIEITDFEYTLKDVSQLKLKYITSFMSINSPVDLYLAFSFDEKLIRYIFSEYTSDIDFDEDEEQLYLEETANDIINIIVGNITDQISTTGEVIQLSPPIVITNADKITKQKDEYFFTVDFVTTKGNMDIFCIGPREVFDTHLKYLKVEQ
jgi:CheY-specific phosphatase CheX